MMGLFDYVVEDLEDVWRDIERSQHRSEGRAIQLLIDRAIELANDAARAQRLLAEAAKAQKAAEAASADQGREAA